MAFAITTILFGNTMKVQANTTRVKRTTLSYSYLDFWEYNNNPGTYHARGQSLNGAINPRDIKRGDSVGYDIPQTYYRGLAANERIVDVNVISSSIGNVSQDQYNASNYEGWASVPWREFYDDQRFANTDNTVNVYSNQLSGTRVPVTVGTRIPSSGNILGKPLNTGAPGNTSNGVRVYKTFLLEWTIEITSPDVQLQTQYYNIDTGRTVRSTDYDNVTKGSSQSRTAPNISGRNIMF